MASKTSINVEEKMKLKIQFKIEKKALLNLDNVKKVEALEETFKRKNFFNVYAYV